MATLHAKKIKHCYYTTPALRRGHQVGASLVEFMMAAMLSLIALAAVGSVFISGQKLATERSKQLLLTQNLSDALKYIKRDVRRAGYSKGENNSLILDGAGSVISTTDGLQYVYKNQGNKYEAVQLKKTGEELTLCLNTGSTLPSKGNLCSNPLSFMDERWIKLTGFEVSKTPLGESVSSALVTISISANFSGATNSQTMSATIKQRNWQ